MIGVLDLDALSPAENTRLNDMAVEIREEFNTLVESVGRAHEASIDWMVSSIASRNKYLSPLFLRCCRLALVESLLDAGGSFGEVRTADHSLAKVLTTHVRKKNIATRVVCTERAGAALKRTVRPVYHFAWGCVLLGLRWLGKSRAAQRDVPRGEPITLLDTFVLKSNIGGSGSIHERRYRDRYYPGILGGLSEKERENTFYCAGFLGFRNPVEGFQLVRGALDRFVIPDDWLVMTDYLFCLAFPFRLLRLRIPRASFRGFDVTSALREEQRFNCANEASLLGLLNYRFAFRFSDAGIPVKLLVDWHENQPLDRGLIAGFRRFQPATSITGYQGYIVATNLHIYVRPTAQESRTGAAPHRIAVIGRALLKELREWSPDCGAVVAPAFRFDQVWNPRKAYPEAGKFTVLVGLPIGLPGTQHILELLVAAGKIGGLSQVRFWLKPHPTVLPERIEPWLDGEFLTRDDIKAGSFGESIEGADLLIGNASSTCVEALAKGVPVIVVGVRQGINENPIPRDAARDMWTLCTTPEEIVDSIRLFQRRRTSAAKEYQVVSGRIREEYFEPVTRAGIREFLEMDDRSADLAVAN